MDTTQKPTMRHRATNGHRTKPAGAATSRLGKQAKKISHDLHDMSDIARNVAQEKFDEMRANAADQFEQGREKVKKVERSFEQLIRDQPLKSLLIAAGVGLFLGRFWMRR